MSTGLRAGTNNDGYLQVNGTDVLTALSSGRIGIGTSTPAADIHLETSAYPTLKIQNTSSASGFPVFQLIDNRTNGVSFNIENGRDAGSLNFRDNTSTADRLTITSAGLVKIPDGGKFVAGSGDDLQIFHGSNLSYVANYTGELIILNQTDDGDVSIHSDNGSGGTAPYFRADGSTGNAILYHYGTEKLTTTTTGAKVTGALEVTQEYPTIRPTLDLNFAATKTLDRRITFTRDSLGTYIDENRLVKYASNNVPRFDHDPTTGESLGLLIEESRTNILGLSTDLTDNNGNDWDNINGTISVNQTTAPDGTTTAASFTAAAGNAEHSVVFAELVPTGNVTASVWIKPNTYSIVSFVLYGEANSTVSYNLSTKTVYNQLSNVSRATITEYPNGWYRISATMNCTVSNSRVYRLFASTGNFNAGGSESFYYWGPQVESGSFETSYIPTYASNTSVTRAADTATIEGTNFSSWYNKNEGTVYSQFKNIPFGAGMYYFGPGGSPRWYSRYEITNGISTQAWDGSGGSGLVNIVVPGVSNNETIADLKHVLSIDNISQQHVGSANGSEVVTGTWDDISDVSTLTLGRRVDTNSYLNAHIKSFKYYPKRLPNAQLQGLTQQ